MATSSMTSVNFNKDSIDQIYKTERNPNKILDIRKTYIEKTLGAENSIELDQKVGEFVRDPSFWIGFLQTNFTAKAPEVFKEARDSKDEICKKACKLAAKYYGFNDPFRLPKVKKGQGELIRKAIQFEYEITVDRLLEQIGYSFNNASSLLTFFCNAGHVKAFKVIFKKWWPTMHLDIQSASTLAKQNLNRLLIQCSVCGDSKAINELLNAGADINSRALKIYSSFNKNEEHYTPLHVAAHFGHIEAMKVLLKAGANIEAETSDFFKPLHIAAGKGQTEAVRVLLDAGAKKNAVALNHLTALHLAVKNDHVKVVRLLLKAGVSKEAKTKGYQANGFRALHLAVANCRTEVVRLLLDAKVNTEAKAEGGWTALHKAAQKNQIEILRMLLESNVNVEARNLGAWTPLHSAVFSNQIEATRELLKSNADINAKDYRGWTPLHRAVSRENLEMVRVLLNSKADPNQKNNNGKTPLDLCTEENQSELKELLKAILKKRRKSDKTPIGAKRKKR